MALQQPKSQKGLNSFLKATILNADSAIYGTVCRYHTNEVGNMCIFGHSCHFLHFAHLERPRLCVQHGPQQMSVETETILKAMTSEIVDLRKKVSALYSSLRQYRHSTVLSKHDDEDSNEELNLSGDADSEDDRKMFAEISNTEILYQDAELLRQSASDYDAHTHSKATSSSMRTKAPANATNRTGPRAPRGLTYAAHPTVTAKGLTYAGLSPNAVLRCFTRKDAADASKRAESLRPSINQLIHGGFREQERNQGRESSPELQEVD